MKLYKNTSTCNKWLNDKTFIDKLVAILTVQDTLTPYQPCFGFPIPPLRHGNRPRKWGREGGLKECIRILECHLKENSLNSFNLFKLLYPSPYFLLQNVTGNGYRFSYRI